MQRPYLWYSRPWGNFEKMRIFEKISQNIEILNFIQEEDKEYMGWRGTLRVLRAETWLTVYRTIAIRKQWLSRADLGPHKMMNQCKILSSYQCFEVSPWEKCTENLVERIMKININWPIHRKRNEMKKTIGAQSFWKIRKNVNFQEKMEKYENFKF